MGRPPLDIDEDTVERLAAIHCTMEEIAAIVECSVDTLERRFAETIKRGREKGKTSLKRWQWKAAEKGNITMLIWLGKQYLGQSDKAEAKLDSNGNKYILSYRLDDDPHKKPEGAE